MVSARAALARTAPARVALACGVLALAACGGGAGSGDAVSAPPAQDLTPVVLSCAADAVVDTPIGSLQSNTWNLQAVGARPWRQCLLKRGQGEGLQYGWQWQWPADGTEVLSYPALVVGAKPWDDRPSNDARFPRKLADTSRLALAYTVHTQAQGSHNLAASIWLINTPTVASPPDETAITTELMVWTDTSGPEWTEGSTPDAVVAIDGVSWQVYVDTQWGDASGSTSHRWTHVVYLNTALGSSVRYDARKLLADAVARGLLAPTDSIASIEMGNELASGSGTTWLTQWSLSVN
jgi:hypothetical protein